jgi:hypothetical protein
MPCRRCDDRPLLLRRRGAISSVFRPASSSPPSRIPASKPPSGANWRHEIKHDGHRIIVRRDDPTVRLYSPTAYWTVRRGILLVRSKTFCCLPTSMERSPNQRISATAMPFYTLDCLGGDPGNVPCRREADGDKAHFLHGRDIYHGDVIRM